MIIATHQPIFSPWLGFFFKALHCDLLVLLDDVQFPRGTTWISRNRFKFHQGELWLTVPVWKKGRGLQKINEVEICYEEDWPRKHIASLSTAYRHAPYWEDHRPFWEETYGQKPRKLVDLNLHIIEYLKTTLAISTKVELSSSLAVEAAGNERLIEICRRHRASVYLAQYEARKFIQADAFARAGIEVRYFRFHHPVYPQLWGDFLYNLSAWDLLNTCGPRSYSILAGSPLAMILPEEAESTDSSSDPGPAEGTETEGKR
ncbi:MAG: WbqC family protein [bacterium]